MRKSLTDKVFLLGVDAMDPRLTRKYVDMGLMPNTKKLLEQGSARKDLVLLGAMPTVTPPQWTTLATGAYPQTHGITAFYRQGSDLDTINLNFSSLGCQAEQLWNVTSEAGKKTLVWHWPGSAWPPSSDNPNLHVVDGTSPGSVNMSTAQIDPEYLLIASTNNAATMFKTAASNGSEVPCVITGLGEDDDGTAQKGFGTAEMLNMDFGNGFPMYIYDPLVEGQGGYIDTPIDVAFAKITEADNKWSIDVPKGTKEFTLLYSYGFIRRPVLVLQNAQGVYDKVAIYKNKRESKPMVEIHNGEYVRTVIDDAIKKDEPVKANRNMRVLEIAPDGNYVKMWISSSMQLDVDKMWHPKDLHQRIVDNIGYPPPTSTLGAGEKVLISQCMYPTWEHTLEWQADALVFLMEHDGYEMVFSHFHAPDLQKHMFIRELAKGRPEQGVLPEDYEKIMQDIYTQTDRYIGRFMHLIDQGWTIMVVSDHAQVCPTYGIRGLGDTGCNLQLMTELGFTVLQKDEKGALIMNETVPNHPLPKIDWTKTTAVANREMHIYLNLEGRTDHGIVKEADRYKLEEDIMTALYGYKDKVSGQRIIAFALRRKDAVLIGLGGEYPQCGDIIYCMAEGYEHDHDDSLSTSWGECDTSVSPIFIGAGPGLKKGFYTNRMIRQVDVTPTIAVLLGIRMPRDCEGAPVYQILSEEF